MNHSTKAWNMWQSHSEFTTVFNKLSRSPDSMTGFKNLCFQKFTILLYDKTGSFTEQDELREHRFTCKGHQMSSLSPTMAALDHHIRQAAPQGGHHWGNITTPDRQLPPSAEWGWTLSDTCEPPWTDLPQASSTCPELLQCHFHDEKPSCKCFKSDLKCTLYCTCIGESENVR